MFKFPAFGQRNNEGPPDLDEVFKDLNNKINQLFGGKGNGNNGGGTSRPPMQEVKLPILPILLVVALLWLASGFYIVDQGSRGVVLRFGEHVETTKEGLHWHVPFPIETVEKVNMEVVRTVEIGYRSSNGGATKRERPSESLMLTDDENIIDLQLAVQYNLKSVEDFLFKNRSTDDSVRAIAETAIREVVGKSKMDFALYEGREELAVNTKALMQEILDRYQSGINVVSVNMQNAQPPEQVQAAFDDAVKAKQDLERQKNEGQAYANDVIPKARGTAARLAEEAAAYKLRVENEATGDASRFAQVLAQYQLAPKVTKQRMYIDTQEQVLSNSTKVLVDQKGGNSMLYMPLDKVMQSAGAAATASRANNVAPVAPSNVVEEVSKTLNRTRDALRNRNRDAR